MRRSLPFLVACLSLILSPAPLLAQEPVAAESRITSVGLFKNGLAVVRRTVPLPADGVYELADVPDAVHGTLWIESDATIQALATTKEMQVPADGRWEATLGDDLAGREVTVHFKSGDIAPATGRVAKFEEAKRSRGWSRDFEQPDHGRYWGWYIEPTPPTGPTQPPTPRFLTLETQKGQILVDPSMIACVYVTDPRPTVTRTRPVLRLTVSGSRGAAGHATISYLTKGMGWAPSYRVDLTDPAKLTLDQNAVIRNELEDFVDAELFLISGYPNVEFGHVLSPMSPRTTWATFFNELSRRIAPPGGVTRGVIAQQVMSNVATMGGAGSSDVDLIPAGEGVDIYYHPVGRQSMKEGDSLLLPVARESAGYERIVEWMVPDTRQANGQPVDDWQRQQFPDQYEDSAWDAARFENPYKFPMTTAPATVVAGGRFNGQRTVTWVNPGEETTLRINKALSLRTRSTEIEEPGEREEFWIRGTRCHRAAVRGELQITNHRKEAVKLVVRRRFSGELTEADREPKTTLLEEGVTSINPRHELVWTLELGPGETQLLSYRYTVHVPF